MWNKVCQTDLPPLFSGRYIVLFLHKDLVLESYLEIWRLAESVRFCRSIGTLHYNFEMCLFSLLYMTTVLIYQFYLHFVLDKATHTGTLIWQCMPGQKFCSVLEKVFTNLSLRFVGENNQDMILYEFSMVNSSNLCSVYIFFHFSFIYTRILIYFQLIAHLFVNMYIITCATCLVKY